MPAALAATLSLGSPHRKRDFRGEDLTHSRVNCPTSCEIGDKKDLFVALSQVVASRATDTLTGVFKLQANKANALDIRQKLVCNYTIAHIAVAHFTANR